jgi:rhodanese-related sulfurtransferase
MRNLSPHQALELLRQRRDAVLLDIRSFAEFWFVGHPVGAVNVPFNDEEWNLNARFVEDAKEFARPDQPVVLICRSGKRTKDAGALLEAAGFTDIYHVTTGFEGDLNGKDQRSLVNGWRHDGLPWEQG